MMRLLRQNIGWVVFLLGAASFHICCGEIARTNTAQIVATNTAEIASTSKDEIGVTNTAPIADTNIVSTPSVPGLGELSSPGVINKKTESEEERNRAFQLQLDLGKEQRRQKSLDLATQTLSALLQTEASGEVKRLALFELALVAQDDNKLARAEQIFAQYIHLYSEDASVPEVMLRQGLIYREMGVSTLAVSKFYAVMSSALKLKLDNMDYYKNLVLQAQIEIADTYYLEGKYEDSSDFYERLLKAGNTMLEQGQIQFKLIRSLSFLTNNTETVAHAQVFLETYTNSTDVPEVRFLLASSLKKMGRNNDAMKQVLLLLQSQEENERKNPETWIYWQQRAGNEIANQLYKEGDYLNSLQIYLSLAELNKTPAWQLPIWYQSALVYEQLQQWQKAGEMYLRIIDKQKVLTDAGASPSLTALFEMAKWRKDYLDWMQKAKITNQAFLLKTGTNASPVLMQ